MILALEIADPVFSAGAILVGTLLIAAVSWTAAALVKATSTLDRLDRDAGRQRDDHDALAQLVHSHLEAEKDRRIEELEMELAKAKGMAG